MTESIKHVDQDKAKNMLDKVINHVIKAKRARQTLKKCLEG